MKPILAGLKSVKMAIKNKEPKEPQWLKKARKENTSTKSIHLFELIISFILIINVIKNLNSHTSILNATVEYQVSKNFCNKSLYISNKRSTVFKSYKNHCVILLLLILSNDINPNPGPKNRIDPASKKCSTCLCEIQSSLEYLKCSTCSKHYHITCKILTENTNQTYTWICSSINCSPNHQKNKIHQNIITNNRWKVLNSESHCENTSQNDANSISGILNGNTSELTPSEVLNKQLLDELTKISPTDLEGKYLCGICYKEVKTYNRAILCDTCDTWSHLKCTDVSVKLYNHFTHLTSFQWNCVKCRKDEQIITEKFDITKFKTSELPDSYSYVKSTNKELVIIHMNCRSMINKREELEYIINETDADLVCLTETWLDASAPAQSFVPDGYKIIRKDRSNDFKQKYGRNKGGGVALLYKEQIQVEKKDYLTDDIEEILWVQVKIKQSFMLGILYRAEYTDLLEAKSDETTIESNIRKAYEISNNIILTGDFNIDISNPENKQTQILNNIYQTYGLTQILDKPTRYSNQNGKPTILDHFWLNENELPQVEKAGTFIGISDHLGTYLKLKKQKNPVNIKNVRFRNFRKYNVDEFNEDLHEALSSSSIQQHIESENINSAMKELISTIQNSINKFAPINEIRIVKKAKLIPWFTKELRELIVIKNEMLQDSFLYGFETFKSQIKHLTNSINHLKRTLKRKFLNESLKQAENDSRKCWDIINTVVDRKQSHHKTEPDMMNQEKANKFNKFFANVGKQIQDDLKLNIETLNFEGLSGFDFQNETYQSIEKLISALKLNTATGDDDISTRILKDASHTISPYLCSIINLGYKIHEFPSNMKKATITALHKKKDVNLISNYRPISILPAISKVIEKSATNQLVQYLEENNILSANQHAYRNRHSTVTCLAEVVDYLYQLWDDKKYAAIISLDLSKAFDSISHQLLLNKLAKIGLSENAILWVKSYLSERSQVTKFKDFTSSEQKVTAGVPQGSIIGPLLFLCFTNDLYENFDETCRVVSYADDTQIIINSDSSNQLKTSIRSTILTAQEWYTKNSMLNNIDKTEILILNSRKSNLINSVFKFRENGKNIKIKPSSSIEVLGIILDQNLNWVPHTNKVKRNAFNVIRHLHRINHLLPIEIKIQLYNTLVTPVLDYADIIWGGCGSINSKKLQLAQNFAIRSITGARKYDSATESFKKLKFLNLEQRRKIHEAVFTNKSLLYLNPIKTSARYIEQCSTGTRTTRSNTSGTLNLPTHKTSKYQQSPFYRCIQAWNSCPSNIPTNAPKPFKKNLQKYIINSTYTN